MKKSRLLIAFTGVLSTAAIGMVLAAAAYSLFGDAMIVTPGNASLHAAQIRSSDAVAPGYGGVDFAIPAGLTVSQLNNLSTDYKFTQGTDGLGSPRFVAEVSTPTNGTQAIFFYLGPPPSYTGDPQNVWLNTGNLASPTNLVDASQLGGAFYEPYGAVQATYGNYPITALYIVVDAGYAGTQTLSVDNVMVNGSRITFDEPKTAAECKNGGYKFATRADGSTFKNQGDCIQYVNTGK